MHFFADYALFFLKIATFVIAILFLVAGLVAIISRDKGKLKDKIKVKKLNKKYNDMRETLRKATLPKTEYKKFAKAKKQQEKQVKRTTKKAVEKKRLFVIDFSGDIRASGVTQLRDEITAILTIGTPKDEVVIRLESPGGLVHSYGLAASQLKRVRENNIPLTVIVDKVAASGGYLMACVANKIISAPFAIIGSIGVVGQLPNFNRFLKRHNIDFEQLTAGEYKRTLTIFGENTEKGRQKFQAEIETTHQLFKDFIEDNRPTVTINKIATGEYWYGRHALEHQLVDALMTSDDYLLDASNDSDIYKVSCAGKKSFMEKIMFKARSLLSTNIFV